MVNDTCDISLSPAQLADVTRLFDTALLTFVFALNECRSLSQTIVEDAVNVASSVTSLCPSVIVAQLGFSRFFFLVGRFQTGIVNVLTSQLEDIPAAAQGALDEFLFTVIDFCDVPLSNTTLAQLDVCYLEDLVQAAIEQQNSG